uniref:Neurotransmitter-gated ion-channel ligand-binding domain-containing protein n=1 Tax=Glossina palpalis gambiensis TaxID=67801 RepID=A0A1B0BHE6_9MUSC
MQVKITFPVVKCQHKSCQGPHEKRLLNHLLSTYNTLERPVANESEPLEVKFGLTLQQIIDVDEKNQILTTNAWLNLARDTGGIKVLFAVFTAENTGRED